MDTATRYRKEITTDLTGFQAFLADRRLARDNPIPYFVRWVERFLWQCHGQLQDNDLHTHSAEQQSRWEQPVG